MSYTVSQTNFEGPLDLLLRLIEREQMDITLISISKVTNDYLEYMNMLSLSPDELNWFIDLATKLVKIKSFVLLPDQDGHQEPIEDDALKLSEQLKTYRRYRKLAKHLENLTKSPATARPHILSTFNPELPPPNLTLNILNQAYRARLDANNEARRNIPRFIINKTNINHIIEKLESKLTHQSSAELSKIINSANNRHETILYFLAILELHKNNKITIKRSIHEQEEKFILELTYA